jgi:hypothetical protein
LFLYQGLDALELFSGISVDEIRVEAAFLDRFTLE